MVENYNEATALGRINALFEDSLSVKKRVLPTIAPSVAQAIKLMETCIRSGGKVMSCGNGGSAADAQHFSAELLNRFEKERAPIAAIALSTDTSTLTSIANDYNYNQVFSKQVYALSKPEDLLLAISTSGNSGNVIAAIHALHEKHNGRAKVIALTGKDGGQIAEILKSGDVEICVASDTTARIQEVHIMVLHALCDGLDALLLG